jgi:DNA-binding transcriptional ArsR family regulator
MEDTVIEFFSLGDIVGEHLIEPSTNKPLRRRYLKGPIPWTWLETASRLPGKALALGMLLWREAGMDGIGPVTITNAKVATLGIDRSAKSRAVADLERAGLVRVERRPRRNPLVTLVATTNLRAGGEQDHAQSR